MARIPFVDLKSQYKAIQGEVEEAIRRVLDQSAFSGGPFVTQFEKEFADFCECPYAIGVGSGTEALWLALGGLGFPRGMKSSQCLTRSSRLPKQLVCAARPLFLWMLTNRRIQWIRLKSRVPLRQEQKPFSCSSFWTDGRYGPDHGDCQGP